MQAFFDRWLSQIPVALTAADQMAGYCWQLSMRQVSCQVRIKCVARILRWYGSEPRWWR